jgi:hypothetical protein
MTLPYPAASIERWFKTHPDYSIYSKNIKPGLSPENKYDPSHFLAFYVES